jgi:uncharacterized protein involved in exopolysaccharide biosynthesis
MLQSLSASPQDIVEPPEQNVGLEYYLAIAKRRLFYFLIPFLLALLLGSLVIAIQRPIYRAAGKILVESQDIPKDLVKPTITDTANQRIQVIQQRSMTRDNLVKIVRKFGLFPKEQRWMSESQLLDLMKARTKLELIDLDLPGLQWQQMSNTIAFTLSFDYEDPGVAAQVTNEFLTGILNDDAVNRTNRAAETTRFMEQEVKRLQGNVATTQAKITEEELKPPDPVKEIPEQYRLQREELTRMKLDLVQKTATYSSEYPEVKSLKKKIAAIEKAVADAPKDQPPPPKTDHGLGLLRQQLTANVLQLDEANRKLSDARLGQSLESNQQSERLQVIEQPVAPQQPIKPNRPKLFALVFALSTMGGLAMVMLAEAFDKSIHGSQDLAGIVDSRLVLAIPYIATAAEGRRKRTRMTLLLGSIATIILGALAVALYLGVELPSWGDQAWLERLTHLSK